MTARDRILSAIRATLGPGKPPAQIAAEAAALLDPADTARPRLAAPALPDAFALKAAALGTSIDRVASMAEVPQAMARYLSAHGLPPSFAMQPAPELAALDWAGLAPHPGTAADEPAALGLALYGIAESGSLVIHSGPENPILMAFLPLHHVMVLRESTLLPHLEDYAARLAAQAIPRNAVLITGPSGTTDIEGSYVRGAHGPGFLHVILIADESNGAG
ncbi:MULTISPECIES: lactate utilization protein [Paracoccus]|uniref:LutC/YkgG family protein n=1 Tax=Paracoccus TaxID=265 RepID=UPI001FB5EC37|nr:MULTISPECIES: lactate utilization protein [Paracoccus]MCJ1900224.1 lactate utilization protein [Paracoccus versutus]MDF3904874.1 lactate utilization protein [Paracoccus sp. AS002]